MNNLLITPLSPEQQQKRMEQLSLLMGKQVKSYHKYHHMGSSSSVSLELAQELMESIEYTLEKVGGMQANDNLEEALQLGQTVLAEQCSRARGVLELIGATAPQWQTECRWDALRYLRHYLDHYDHLHLSHKGPADLFYPVLIAQPEGVHGLDQCLFYLNILWIENQIMAAIPEKALNALWDRIPVGTLNQCEHLLINGVGKALIGTGIDPLVFAPEEYQQLFAALFRANPDILKGAAELFCKWIDLADEYARMYVSAIIPQLMTWTGEQICNANIENVFL